VQPRYAATQNAQRAKVIVSRVGLKPNERLYLKRLFPEAVVRHGVDWCKERPEETFLSCFKELRDNQDDGPHFMPERIKSVGPGTPSVRVPKRCSVEHEWVSTSYVKVPIVELRAARA
jgi:hypothetical protein